MGLTWQEIVDLVTNFLGDLSEEYNDDQKLSAKEIALVLGRLTDHMSEHVDDHLKAVLGIVSNILETLANFLPNGK